MIVFLWYLLAFLVALGILVTIHEYGHFWVARRLGFKVLKFSVGFGKPIWQRTGKDGVQYIIASIPLGGYVKMLDSREGPIAESEQHLDFNKQPVLNRIAVVIAGPIANFLFAIAAYWALLMLGVTAVKPILGALPDDGIAANAGLKTNMEIFSVDGKPTQTWEQVQLALVDRMGEKSAIKVLAGEKRTNAIEHKLNLMFWEVDTKRPDILGSLGLVPYTPPAKPIVAGIAKNSAAAKVDLKVDDEFVSVAGKPLSGWEELVDITKKNPGKPLSLTIRRGQELKKISITPETKTLDDGQTIGVMGVAGKRSPWPEAYLVKINYGFFDGFTEACKRTWQIVVLTFNGIKKLIIGVLPLETLSGAVSIAQGAGVAASYGLQSFLKFLAMISVNLGLINLLPIPVLDGGHLMFYLYEWVRGKPVPERIQETGLRIGMALILSLMFIAIYYDIVRLNS